MSNEKYNHIIDKVYEKYAKDIQNQRGLRKNQNEIIEKIISAERIISQKEWTRVLPVQLLSREEFINVCKIDSELSKSWDLKIEERGLSKRERIEMIQPFGMDALVPEVRKKWMEENNIPTKLITVTYNNETIEIYE